MSLDSEVCHDVMTHDYDMLSETLYELNILIDDVTKIVSEYYKLPLFDMRSAILERYFNEEKMFIFGNIKEEYVNTIVEYYNKKYLRFGVIFRYTIYKCILFFLDDNSNRCIITHMREPFGALFIVSDDRINAEFVYIAKLNTGKIWETSGDNIYSRSETFSAKINKLVREENYSIIYTDMAIFLIDNNKINF